MLTPIVGQVPYAPIPFAGSDGRTHLVYELETTNFSSGKTTIEQLEVLDADTNDVVATLDAEEVAARLQPAGLREPVDTGPVDDSDSVSARQLRRGQPGARAAGPRLSVEAAAAPPDQHKITEKVGLTRVDRRDVVVVGPRYRGSNYVAADSCCDATRHGSAPDQRAGLDRPALCRRLRATRCRQPNLQRQQEETR